jgi:hypothetical protein
MAFHVYIIQSVKDGSLYIGHTQDLHRTYTNGLNSIMIKIEKHIHQNVVHGNCSTMKNFRHEAWPSGANVFLNLMPVLMRRNYLPAYPEKTRNISFSAAPGAGRRFKSCRPDLL